MKNKKKVYFISGGGTGGHIYPALAIIKELQKTEADIYYVGNPKNPEYKIAKENNIKFLPVNISGMPRKISLGSIFWVIKLLVAIITSSIYILKYKPDLIVGTGGYVSAPILFAGHSLKIPFALHDADAQPGIVTRCFASRAKLLTTPFETTKKLLPMANIKVTGNPIREEFATTTKAEAKAKLNIKNKITILVMGGSQGAKSINLSLIPIIKKLNEDFDAYIIHQTGKRNYQATKELLDNLYPEWKNNQNYTLMDYIEDMPTLLKSSDIAISRSGSLSLSEIKASGLASILIPYPFAAGDHQRKNAQSMVEEGCSIMIEDNNLSAKMLYETLSDIINTPEKLKNMQSSATQKAAPFATKDIIENLLEL